MTSPIQSPGPFVRPTAIERPAFTRPDAADGAPQPGGPGAPFGKMLFEAIESTTNLQQAAHTGLEDHLTGASDTSMTEVLTTIKKADLALRTMIQVRNKLLEAYDEIQQLRM